MLTVHQPPHHLSQHVNCFWFGSFENSQSSVFTHLAHATTMPQLIFHLDGIFTEATSLQQVFHAGLYGHSTTYKTFTSSCKAPAIFGIQLYPSALRALFDFPAEEFKDRAVNLNTLLGYAAEELLEKIFLATDHADVLKVAVSFLERRLTYSSNDPEYRLRQLVRAINKTNGKLTMHEMVDMSCLSERQLQRRFKDMTGLSPKAYARIVRFESLIERFSQPGKNLADIADSLGYHDLSHCNHEFRSFTGLSPSAYLRHYGNQYL